MEKNGWTPADLLQLSGGYWSTCALHAGVELDLFTPLAAEALTSPVLAGRLGCDERGLAMLLNALTALGLLTKDNDRYATTPPATRFIARTSPDYLGHIILHHHHLMASWLHLADGVRNGRPVREQVAHTDDETVRESFEMGMFNLAMLAAPLIVPHIDLSGRRRLLDLGGGPGTYAIHFCQHNPELTALVYDLPSTRPFAEMTIDRFSLANRIEFRDGDFLEDDIEGHYDVAWLSHILHAEGPENCALILCKTAAALEPGGMVLVQEFILDDTRDAPLFPALFSLNMLLGTTAGQSYSQGELSAMLKAAGFTDVHRIPLKLPNGAGVMAATLPGK